MSQDLTMKIVFKERPDLEFQINFGDHFHTGAAGSAKSLKYFSKEVKGFIQSDGFNAKKDIALLFEVWTLKGSKFRWVPCVITFDENDWTLEAVLAWSCNSPVSLFHSPKTTLSMKMGWTLCDFILGVRRSFHQGLSTQKFGG